MRSALQEMGELLPALLLDVKSKFPTANTIRLALVAYKDFCDGPNQFLFVRSSSPSLLS